MVDKKETLGKCLIKVPCDDCLGSGKDEPFNPFENCSSCFWCDGTGVADFEEVYDTYGDALMDYPDALEIIKLKETSGRYDAFIGLQEKPE